MPVRVLVSSLAYPTLPYCTAKSGVHIVLRCPGWSASTASNHDCHWDEVLDIPNRVWHSGRLVLTVCDSRPPAHLNQEMFCADVRPDVTSQRCAGVGLFVVGAVDAAANFRAVVHRLVRHHRCGAALAEMANNLKQREKHSIQLRRQCQNCRMELEDERSARVVDLETYLNRIERLTGELNVVNKELARIRKSRVLVNGKYVLF